MKRIIYILCALALVASLWGCADDEPELRDDAEMPIVVEGWIENGAYPMVIITRAIDLTKPMDSLDN